MAHRARKPHYAGDDQPSASDDQHDQHSGTKDALAADALPDRGDVDRIVPTSATATVADLLGAEARTIADTGHLPLDERPQEVADVLLEFISSY